MEEANDGRPEGASSPAREENPDGQEHAVILHVNNRFKRRTGKEVCVTELNEVVSVHKFDTQPAIVRRGYGLTLNQGDFNSARIDVSVEVPCYLEDIALADKWAAEFVEKRLTDEVTSLGKGGGNTSIKRKESSPL